MASHNGEKIEALRVEHPDDIWKCLDDDTQVVAIDEVQFFSPAIVSVCQDLADKGKRVILAGLDQNFKAEPSARCLNFFLLQNMLLNFMPYVWYAVKKLHGHRE